jgi:hypothetical protein
MLIDNNGEYNFWTTEVLTINYWVRCSADLLPPSPPAEKATARQDQVGKKVHPPTIEGSVASLQLDDVARK